MEWRLASLGLMLIATSHSRGAEWQFAVSIDHKPVDKFTITVTHVEPVTEIHSKLAITGDRAWQLSYEGSESWKDGRLVRLEGSGTQNDKKGSVSLIDGKGGYALTAGDKEVTVRGDVWPTTFWIRPDTDKPMIVDALTGEVSRVKIEPLGPDRLMVDGKAVRVLKYRLTTAGMVTELWYDSSNRLTRRKWEDHGRSIVMELIRIKTD